LVRDSLKWSRTIDDILVQFGAKSSVMLASHHWPIWGKHKVQEALRNQRDTYRFTHDQTLRLANQGATMDEIANAIGEPDFAARDFGTRGYYGTYEHNSRAVYQRYFGWWNAVPADYDPLPKAEEAAKWIEALGGAEAALEKGKSAFEAGDYRWGARLLQTLVFAQPENEAARQWLAATYEQLGFQSEGGTWRNIYLSAADELRSPRENADITTATAGVLAAVPTLDLFDALATRFNPAKMQGEPAVLQFTFPDTEESINVDMRPSIMYPRAGMADNAVAALTLARSDFNLLLAQEVDIQSLIASGAAKIEGNPLALLTLFQSLDQPDPQFDIVAP
jgi:linear primary-alkylsulfatase